MLEALGLEPEVQAVYAAMLADPALGVNALAERIACSEAEIRQRLNRLADLELLRPSRENPGRMTPISPSLGLQALIRRQEEELAARRRQIDDARAAAARIVAEHAVVDPRRADAESQHIVGLDAIQAKLEEVAAAAHTETLSVVPGKAVPADVLTAAKAADADLIARRRIPSKILYQDAIRNDRATVAYGLWLAEIGAEVRTAPVLPQRMFIIDRTTAFVPLDPSDPGAGALCTTAPGVVTQLVAFFEQIWQSATPLGEHRPVEPATGLTRTERELLKLLASGATDESAAHRLGLGPRTVRRIMADLMSRLDAGSRFEAGIKAAKNGWL